MICKEGVKVGRRYREQIRVGKGMLRGFHCYADSMRISFHHGVENLILPFKIVNDLDQKGVHNIGTCMHTHHA